MHYKLAASQEHTIRMPTVHSSSRTSTGSPCGRAARLARRVGQAALLSAALAGCASGGLVDKTMEMVGLKKPEMPSMDAAGGAGGTELPTLNGQMPKLPTQRRVAVRIHAGQVLNTDASGRSLAVVVRLYGLRGTTQFTQATYAMFAAGSPEKPFSNGDVVSSKEVVLVPGQKYEMLEALPNDVTHLAVVALFRSPDSQRWPFASPASSAPEPPIPRRAGSAAARTSIKVSVVACHRSGRRYRRGIA